MAVNKTVVGEGIFLFVISLVGMTEVYRLMTHKDPYLVYGAIVPGVFVLLASIALMSVSVAHVIANHKEFPNAKKVAENKQSMIRTIGVVVVFAIYIILIPLVGYLMASIVFFILEFRLAGIKSWLFCFAVGLIAAVCCYVIFVKYCGLVFPRGMLFG